MASDDITSDDGSKQLRAGHAMGIGGIGQLRPLGLKLSSIHAHSLSMNETD
jgi:hypothetical protein